VGWHRRWGVEAEARVGGRGPVEGDRPGRAYVSSSSADYEYCVVHWI
jgi:hypothetical protein